MAKNKKPKFLISIHAPREGGDHYLPEVLDRGSYFNPRPPRGGRLLQYNDPEESQEISIHAPREGATTCEVEVGHEVYISIHAPREGGDRKRLF